MKLFISFLKRIFSRKKDTSVVHPHNLIEKRKMVTSEDIRKRAQAMGFKVLELPLKRTNRQTGKLEVYGYSVIASKGEISCHVQGKTIDEALMNMAYVLGLVPNNK